MSIKEDNINTPVEKVKPRCIEHVVFEFAYDILLYCNLLSSCPQIYHLLVIVLFLEQMIYGRIDRVLDKNALQQFVISWV